LADLLSEHCGANLADAISLVELDEEILLRPIVGPVHGVTEEKFAIDLGWANDMDNEERAVNWRIVMDLEDDRVPDQDWHRLGTRGHPR